MPRLRFPQRWSCGALILPVVDASGTVTGSATVDGSGAVYIALSETMSGSGDAGPPAAAVDLVASEALVGAATVQGDVGILVNVSGFLQGAGEALATFLEADGIAIGGSLVTANAQRLIGISGYTLGSGIFGVSVPEPIYGIAVVTAHMEVDHVPPPVSDTVSVPCFRWGHTFTRGGLTFKIRDGRGNPLGPVCVSYTLFQMQRGCQTLKQIGPSNRKPVQTSVGCYYVTGTAGECGQPGLWAVKWRYQRTYADPVVEKTCYFQVVDSVNCPIPGDTLDRNCKYGWD